MLLTIRPKPDSKLVLARLRNQVFEPSYLHSSKRFVGSDGCEPNAGLQTCTSKHPSSDYIVARFLAVGEVA